MGEQPSQNLYERMAPQRAAAVDEAHPLRWQIVERHPVATAVLLVVATVAALNLESVFDGGGDYADSIYGTILRVLLCLALVWFAARSGLLRAIGLTSSPVWRAAWLYWLPVVLLLIFVLFGEGATDDGRWLGLTAVNVFFVGFLEELLTRGLVLFLLLYAWRERKHGVVMAVLVSSALFGVAHLINSITGSAAWGTTLVQVVYATFIGVGLAGLVLRTNTLWIGVVWHAAVDFVGDMSGPSDGTAEASLTPILLLLPMFVYGLYLIRRRTPAADEAPSDQPTVT